MPWWPVRRPGPDRTSDDAVARAFAAVPRESFLPPAQRRRADHDGPIDIGHGQTNSQPLTVAAMLRLLDVRPRQRVLDVGAGSGWTTALLATLVGPGGRVLGLERVPELARWGAENLRAHACGRTDLGHATLEPADPGELGRAAEAPWDRILVSAMARELPETLVEQLADDGRLVCPVDGQMVLVRRHGTDRTVSRHGAYRFVPLVEP
jgi:protein-L-isoaspartate(D-aspartate) O-methyltransferase